MFHSILLASDGSAAAERACAITASLASSYSASVFIIHAFHKPPNILAEPNYNEQMNERRAAAYNLVDDVANRLKQQGVSNVTNAVIEGHASDVILNVIGTHHPDLLIIGARGMSPWRGLVMGSVSLAVTQRATCPVLVVK
ncbi:universal stress protein [Candidatus Viridilinea mediisalina]|nr:universal stress protein [Candidatus Viridilinea mediisalina]